jgi:hypothetical protein
MPKKLLTDITPEHLDGIARHVEEFAGNCRAIAATMRGNSHDTIPVSGWQQTGKAVGNLDAFVSAMRDGLAIARQARGELPPLPPSQKAKNGVPESRKKRAGK